MAVTETVTEMVMEMEMVNDDRALRAGGKPRGPPIAARVRGTRCQWGVASGQWIAGTGSGQVTCGRTCVEQRLAMVAWLKTVSGPLRGTELGL